MVESIRTGEGTASVGLEQGPDPILVAQAETVPLAQEAPSEPVQPDQARVVVEIEDGEFLRLPATASVDQPRVNGADLEFVQADGSVIVVPGGAIQGLTIFIGDIEIPPLAVAALFEANGIEAAAGPGGSAGGARSSGGNFEVPVGGIGDAFDLGDLLPPTALAFGTNVQRPLFEALVIGSPSVGGNDTLRLNDDDLPGGNLGGLGDDLSGPLTGTLNHSYGPNGTGSVLLTGATFPAGLGFASVVSSGGLVLTISQNGNDVMRITLADSTSGNFTVVQLGAVSHPQAGVSEDNVLFDINYRVSDIDGDFVDGVVSVNIDDDSPTITAAVVGSSVMLDETLNGPTSNGVLTSPLMSVTSAAAIVSVTASYGADGAGTTTYALSVTNAASGLATAQGDHAITLVQVGSTIEGQYTDGGTKVAFTVSIGADGKLTVTQNVALEHLQDGSTAAAYDDALTLVGKIGVTATVTDADGDSASTAVIDVGGAVTFKDDGPTITAAVVGSSVMLDETLNGPTSNGVLTSPLMSVTSAAAIVSVTASYGADGAGTTTYALSVTNAASGLATAQGDHAITLVQVGSTIEGQYTDGGTKVAFTVSIGADGKLTVTQNVALEHLQDGSTAAAYDDALTLVGKIGVTATVTDADGDSASTAVIDVGGAVTFKDDGPTKVTSEVAVLSNGAGSAVQFALDLDSTLTNNYGADGPGTVRFAPSLNGANSGLTSNGTPIFYSVNGLVLTATAGVGGATVFTVTLNPTDATYSVDMDGKVDSVTRVDFTSGLYNFSGGNDPWVGYVPTGQTTTVGAIDDNSSDLLVTPVAGGSPSGSINQTNNIFGVNNTTVNANQGIRLDFVQDLTGDGGGPGAGGYEVVGKQDHLFDKHYDTNGASMLIKSTNGSTVRFAASDDPDGPGNTSVGDGSPVPITSVAISYNGASALVSSGTPSVTVGLRLFTLTWNIDGTVDIGNVAGASGSSLFGTTIAIFTAAPGYNSLLATNVGGEAFQVGGFGGSVPTSEPVTFDIPIQIVDADGDTASSQIDLTLMPANQGVWHLPDGTTAATATDLLPHIIGTSATDTLTGNSLANILSGGPGDDVLIGLGGNDLLIGGLGNDTLSGGDGNDRLFGGAGSDTMTGGSGNDVFVIDADSLVGGVHDFITDFAAGDVIDLTALLSGILPADLPSYVRYDADGNPTGQSGSLQVDIDGAAGPGGWETVAIVQNAPATVSILFNDDDLSAVVPTI